MENAALRHQLKAYKRSEQAAKCEIVIADSIAPKKSCSKTWAALIKKIYEVDPLSYPRCSSLMRIISIINNPLVVEKILKHLGLWQPQGHSPPVSEETKIVEEAMYDFSFFNYLPA